MRSMGCLTWGLFFLKTFLSFSRLLSFDFYTERRRQRAALDHQFLFSFLDTPLGAFVWNIFILSTAPSCSSFFIPGKHFGQSLLAGSPAPNCRFIDLPVKMLSAYYCWRPVYDGYECLQLLEQNGGFGNSAAQPPMQIQNLHNNAGNVCFQTAILLSLVLECCVRCSVWALK